METTKIEIIGNVENPTCAKVFIDGKEIHGVKGYTLSHNAQSLPELELDLNGMKMDMIRFETDITETAKVTIRRA